MDILLDGLNTAEHAAEDLGQAGGHGASFADTAAHPDAGADATHAGEASSSWWDRAVSGVKSAAGAVDGAMHSAGHAVDQVAEAGIGKATDAVRSVAGDRAASLVHGAAEGVRDQAKQAAGLTYGVGAGATEALGGMVEGTGNLVRSGAKFATDSQFRGQVVHGAEALGSQVAQHPLASAKALGSGVVHAGEDWLRGAGKAAQEGDLGEYVGRGAGSAVVNVGSFFIPGADVAEGANVASHLGEAGEVASGAARALGAGEKVAEGAGGVERAAGGVEHAAAAIDHEGGATEHVAAGLSASARVETATVWRNTASWTLGADGRPSEASATLREAFSGLKRSPEELRAQDAVRNRQGSLPDDDAGHIFGHRFMPDQGERNMFPQHFNFNRGAYKTLENEWAEWTKQGGEVNAHAVFVGGTPDRPDRLIVSYDVRNAAGDVIHSDSVPFDNLPGQHFNRVPTSDIKNHF